MIGIRKLPVLAAAMLAAGVAHGAHAQSSSNAPAVPAPPDTLSKRWSSFLPLLGEEARKRGIELPLPFGAGLVLYYLDRDILIRDVRIGRNGDPPASVSDYATLSAESRVVNVNAKLDAWILPFVNVYVIAGYLHNESDTRIDVELPPLLPGGPTRRRTMTVPTEMDGSVGGVGMTLAGGYGPYFMIVDLNAARADLGFDDRFDAFISSARAGWNGRAGAYPFRAWANLTDWDTEATATGSVADPDGGNLAFEVDQGPAYRKTYGVGAQCAFRPSFELAADVGFDLHGGWYLALVPVVRF